MTDEGTPGRAGACSGSEVPLIRPRLAELPSAALAGEGVGAANVRTLTFAGSVIDETRPLAVECPVQVSFGDVPFGVMMLTPDDLEDFAYGFSLTEGVIDEAVDVRNIVVDQACDGLLLRVDLSGAKLHAHLARKRALSGRTSCGLCGIEDMSALPRARAGSTKVAPRVNVSDIGRALKGFGGRQPLNAETRAVHGAAWCNVDGRILHVREDVGRHNALDKLIGALLRAGTPPDRGFILITSRASFEMVEKAAVFGCRTLVAISAPTALALERARALDLTLVGIARHDAVTVFHGFDRIIPDLL